MAVSGGASMVPVPDQFEIVSDVDGFLALEREWEKLAERAHEAYFSQSFAWCRISWETVAKPRRRRLRCVVARKDGRLVLVWPFVVHRRFLWTVMRPLGPETTEYTEPLVEDGPEAQERVAAAWRFLRRSGKADIISVPFVREGSALHRVVFAEKPVVAPEIIQTTHVDCAAYPDWESYQRTRDGDWRRGIGRRRRRLRERGKLNFEPILDGAQCRRAIDWILAQKQEWLQRTKHRNAWLGTDEYRNFLLAMSAAAGRAGRIVVSVLRINDTIIAAGLGRMDRIRIEGVITAFDPAYSVYAPGKILQEEALKWAFRRRLGYDMRIGAEKYKEYWSTGTSNAVSYDFAQSAWGRFFPLLRRWHQARLLVPTPLRRLIKLLLKAAGTAASARLPPGRGCGARFSLESEAVSRRTN